jgi:hypothetical protein
MESIIRDYGKEEMEKIKAGSLCVWRRGIGLSLT